MSQQIKHLNEENVRAILKWINLSASIDKSIDDLNIRTDAVFSSKKVSELTQDVKHSLEQYIQSSINGLTHLKKKIVDTLPSDADAEENILYLVKDASVVDDVVYNQYLLIDGVLEPLGNTSTNMSNYYNKDQSDAKFALLSNLQTLIDMVGNASDLETTAKDTLVNAINEIKEGLDDCITKDAIVTTLDDTVTDEQVPSAKAVYEKTKDTNIKTYTSLEQLGLTAPVTTGELFNAMPNNSICRIPATIGDTVIVSDTPYMYGILLIDKSNSDRFDIEFKKSHGGVIAGDEKWIGQLKGSDGTGLTWKRICTTSVPDVPKTSLTPVFPIEVVVGSTGVNINYIVRNGWCNVNFEFSIASSTTFSWTDIATGLPKPANSLDVVLSNEGGKINRPIPIKINSSGTVSSMIPTEIGTADWWNGNISYPVAE